MHIALGWPYRGRRVEQGPVVYCAFEGADGFYRRAEAFRRAHEIKDKAWFYLLGSSAKLVRDHKALIQSIDGQTGDRPPTIVVLDTLNRSIDGSESKDVDMGAYLAAAEAICDAFACVVIIVHHSGIDATRPRGHTALTGAAAVQISVKRDAALNIIAEVEAMKDGPEGASFTSALKVVEVGTDDAGKAITSCAIVAVEAAPASAGKRAGIRITANQRRFLDILRDAIADAPADLSGTATVPSSIPAVTRDMLKKCCVARGWLDETEGQEPRQGFGDAQYAGRQAPDRRHRSLCLDRAMMKAQAAQAAQAFDAGTACAPRATVSAGAQAPQAHSLRVPACLRPLASPDLGAGAPQSKKKGKRDRRPARAEHKGRQPGAPPANSYRKPWSLCRDHSYV